MDVTQIKNLTMNAIAQTLGAGYMTQEDGSIAPLDDSKLVDVGKALENIENGVENFAKSLLDQLAKMYVVSDAYKNDLPDIFVDSFEWGGFIEVVNFDLATVIDDPMFNLIDGQSYADEEHTFYRPKVNVKIFDERKSIAIPWSIAREQMMSAFNGIEQMNSFISGLNVNIENTYNIILETYCHILVSTAVAISDKATHTSVHLVTEYNAETGNTETDPNVILNTDENFLMWVSKRIKDIKRNIKKMSRAYNDGTVNTFTPVDKDRTLLIGKFVDAIKFGLRADTYHTDEVGFGDYKELAFWQGHYTAGDDTQSAPVPEKDFTFENCTTIAIKGDANNKLGIGTNDVTINNVVGLIYDKRGIGLCPYKTKVTASYTASADFTTYWRHILLNYIINSNFNIVALIMD